MQSMFPCVFFTFQTNWGLIETLMKIVSSFWQGEPNIVEQKSSIKFDAWIILRKFMYMVSWAFIHETKKNNIR